MLPNAPAIKDQKHIYPSALRELCRRKGVQNATHDKLPFVDSIHLLQLCRSCFYQRFEDEIHQTIVENSLFKRGERVAVGASGEYRVSHELF